MKNFKIGQKVVFLGVEDNPGGIYPAQNEIVTISQYFGKGPRGFYWFLYEYPVGRNGKIQVFNEKSLFPLKEFGDYLTRKMLKDLSKKIYKTPAIK